MTAMEPQFTMTESDRRSSLWLRLSEHLTNRLAQYRGKNDGPLTPDETARMRGCIACVKEILALGNEPPKDGIE